MIQISRREILQTGANGFGLLALSALMADRSYAGLSAVPGPHFKPRPRPDGTMRWLADLPALARERLRVAGLTNISGGVWCTVEDASRFFSFRRDGVTGRMAAAVWLRR